ncbi:class I SAM-dependent methyltransferase [Xanthomonas sp. WHRI 7945]|nr:class I SAM-dependent methyltransferase [Xanthomonas campestris pv. campestris]
MSASEHHLKSLQAIRAYELRQALAFFPVPAPGRTVTVLELGAGTGQQALMLRDAGYEVSAVDLPSSHYHDARVFEVEDYDGRTLPFAEGAFDIVFSSNVLEHVADIDRILDETRRVLKRNGHAVHVLPSSSCRLWSIPGHYLWLARRVLQRVSTSTKAPVEGENSLAIPKTPSGFDEWRKTLFPSRHGERGNVLTETFYFSRSWWSGTFRKGGFEAVTTQSTGIFYTMCNSFAHKLSISRRQSLSFLLGSSCHIYVLRKLNHAPDKGVYR